MKIGNMIDARWKVEEISERGGLRLNEMNRIYSNTKLICFGNENIYLVENC